MSDEISSAQRYAIRLLEEEGLEFEGETRLDAWIFINEHEELYAQLKQKDRERRRRARRRDYSNCNRGFRPNYENMSIHEEAMNDVLAIDYCGGGHD